MSSQSDTNTAAVSETSATVSAVSALTASTNTNNEMEESSNSDHFRLVKKTKTVDKVEVQVIVGLNLTVL